jgi:hypothetical protein
VQALAWHATALKKLPWPAESLRVGWMAHVVPFHRSTRVVDPAWAVPFRFPTAVQADADVQDTAASRPPGAGLGVDWIDQPVPFQRSASGPTGFPELSVRNPTTVHADGEVHATPVRRLPGDPVGTGTVCRCQRAPSHRSEKIPTGAPELLKAVPAAMHDEPEVQLTPSSHFASRDELLTELVIDAYDDLADALRAATSDVPSRRPRA